MIIDKVNIEKFRGFENVGFTLGEYVTLIAGQNGTQKSTLLGILTQTFTIPFSGHPFSSETPLTGGSFRSSFQDKFRLSPTLDLPGHHNWTMYFKDKQIHPDVDENGGFTIESIPRKSGGKAGVKDSIRFWQKGKRDAGSGYVQLPVIFLSLKRLIPIAESGNFNKTNFVFTDEEIAWYSKNYNKILISRDQIESVDYLENSNKNTIGTTTDYYDWNSNSAGQDNLGRILLAIISFKRLKEKYPNDYKGGILAIDEIDATLYPASQVQLLDILSSLCRKNEIQIIATTHSLHLLEKISELKNEKRRDKQFNTVYLKKVDGKVTVQESPSYDQIVYNLNVSSGKAKKASLNKVFVYTEDKECMQFTKAIIGRRIVGLKFPDIPLGCENLIELGKKNVISFSFPNSIVVLDGDASKAVTKANLKNYICLPGELSPERMLAKFLSELSDESLFWEEKTDGYSKQVCFRRFTLDSILSSRDDAKKWYKEQIETEAWGPNGVTLYKYFFKEIPVEVNDFIEKFKKIHSYIK